MDSEIESFGAFWSSVFQYKQRKMNFYFIRIYLYENISPLAVNILSSCSNIASFSHAEQFPFDMKE